jgi:protein-tyrosine phosphatase
VHTSERRTLAWDGCLNVRDLGGHPTEDGGTTVFGRIVRADSVRQLSDEGWRALVDYGIGTIVDLRLHEELEADPPLELPVAVVHVSLFGSPDLAYWGQIDAVGRAAPNEVLATRNVYLRLLEDNRDNVAAAVAAVADAPEGGVLVHCQAGKDRTGLVTALLLRVAGVGYEEIADDYARSADALAPVLDDWIDESPDEDERERRRRQSATPAAAMHGVLEELERRHGGVESFLRATGVTDDQLTRVHSRLRDRP